MQIIDWQMNKNFIRFNFFSFEIFFLLRFFFFSHKRILQLKALGNKWGKFCGKANEKKVIKKKTKKEKLNSWSV